MFYAGFFILLRSYGVPVSLRYIIDFYTGIEKGLARDLDELFVLARLCFVKKNEHLDSFERAFALYFFDKDIPRVAQGDAELLETEQFRQWLNKAWQNGQLEAHPHNFSIEELMRRFWQTMNEQTEEHHGGSKWVGTGGSSAYGHSGKKRSGIRVFGGSKLSSAMKVIGERRYVDYSDKNTLKGEHMRQAIAALKHLKPAGSHSILNLDKTIDETAKNGGEIDLVFEREIRDKLKVVLLLDNGGTSMMPYIRKTRMLFSKITNQLKSVDTYFFHNTIYSYVFKDAQRTRPWSTEKLLKMPPDTRVIVVGDASMGPHELYSNYGNINYGEEEYEPSIHWLRLMRERFDPIVWLNPIQKQDWHTRYGAHTIGAVADVIPMFDMSIRGIEDAVDYLNRYSHV